MSWSPPVPREAPPGVKVEDSPSQADLVKEAIQDPRMPVYIVRDEAGGLVLGLDGSMPAGFERSNGHGDHPLVALLPPLYPECLGDRTFCKTHRVRLAYAAGAMAHGIASPRLVTAMAQADLLAFLGTAGLAPSAVEQAIDQVLEGLGGRDKPWGVDLIHTPGEPELEAALVDIYLRRGLTCASASAFMRLTPSVVRYACTGLRRGESGRIERRNRLFAKLSRPEIASLFMSPAPTNLLDGLVAKGQLTREEAEFAAQVPLAEDITVESDSAGHTDNRPLGALWPVIAELRDRLLARHDHEQCIRIGAAGGLGAPGAVAAAFALGADFVLTGSINQCTVEAGQSEAARKMLAQAGFTDVAMAPSPDMFELGVKVQVLKRGTLYAARAAKLYELYRSYSGLEDLPAAVTARLESEIFQRPLERVCEETRQYFAERAPRELERAAKEPKHRMALVFRWYLGQSSHWAIEGTPGRELDYQIWCGPAMGACNAWLAGSFMEDPSQRSVVQLACNLMDGAAVVTRAHQLRSYGVPVEPASFAFRPRRMA